MNPTLNQLSKKIRIKKIRHSRVKALLNAPQRKGIVYKIAKMSPRKPNSARRTFAKVRIIINNKKLFAKIPGIGEHYLQPHSLVLVRGHGPKDSPGINYHLIRGLYDFSKTELFGRRNRRSKFGVKNIKKI
jgi:small subunit ribosomal protein S12